MLLITVLSSINKVMNFGNDMLIAYVLFLIKLLRLVVENYINI